MKVYIKYSAHLHIDGLENGVFVDVEPDITVSDLLSSHRVDEGHKRFITVVVNGVKKNLSCRLRENDRLFLLLPVGGG